MRQSIHRLSTSSRIFDQLALRSLPPQHPFIFLILSTNFIFLFSFLKITFFSIINKYQNKAKNVKFNPYQRIYFIFFIDSKLICLTPKRSTVHIVDNGQIKQVVVSLSEAVFIRSLLKQLAEKVNFGLP